MPRVAGSSYYEGSEDVIIASLAVPAHAALREVFFLLWSIEQANPRGARGWVVTNEPTESAQLKLFIFPSEWRNVACNVMRADVLASGAHATGVCGFEIDAHQMADAFRAKAWALCEAKTGLVIHRHVIGHTFATGRVFFLAFPGGAAPISSRLSQSFRLAYHQAESMDQPTLHSLLTLRHQNSLFVAGAMAGDEIDRALDATNCVSVAFLPQPERLNALRLARLCETALDEAAGPGFRVTSPFARLTDELIGIDQADPEAMNEWVERLNEAERLALSDPMTRQLSGVSLDKPVTEQHLVEALKRLSRFDAVGTAEHADAFERLLREMLGPSALGPRHASDQETDSRVDLLSASEPLGRLASIDRMLYDLTRLGEGPKDPPADRIASILGRKER